MSDEPTLTDTTSSDVTESVGAEIDRGDTIGRYVVLSKLGAGAMGVVFAAYDPQLDRRVALKLLTPQRGESTLARARLQREAQSLAKLAHGNVVGVHDVGMHGEQLFVAMEFVDGQTLGAWMRAAERPHPWREIVQVFLEAGRGLAAAHGANLVHRDFKPDNVMLGNDGRVRVMDFGLARSVGEEDAGEAATMADSGLTATLTQTGALLGTPAYMASEQWKGLPADAHSDQFAFCVALYEALYGLRPFVGHHLAALIDAVESERIEAAPRDTDVPAWLRKVVVRGLAKSREQRWPSMQALLDALADDPALRRRKWVGGALVVGLLAGAAWGAWVAVQPKPMCAGMDEDLAGIWDPTRRDEVEAAMLGSSSSHGADTWERVARQLDEWTDAWVAARVDACEATHHGEQSGELLDLRMACLDEQLQRLQAVVDELALADATVVGKAVQMVAGLPLIDHCADVDALMAEVPPPEDPAVREQVAALDQQLVVARAKHDAGKYEPAKQMVDAAVRDAIALGYEPLTARALLLQGTLQAWRGDYASAEATLERAYDTALSQRMLEQAASASSWLMYVVGYDLGRTQDGRRWGRDAGPLARAVGSNQALSSYLESASAIAELEGNLDEARGYQERSLALIEAVRGPDHIALAPLLNNLGIVADLQGKPKEARAYYERALAIRERAQGPWNPMVGSSLANLATVAIEEDKFDEAKAHLQRAIAIQEAALGPEHPHLADTLDDLGMVAQREGKYDEARRMYERALAILERAQGPEHPEVADTLANLGGLAFDEQKFVEATAYFERALAIRTASGSTESLAELRFHLAQAIWSSGGDRARALELARLSREGDARGGEAAEEHLRTVDEWLARTQQ